MNRIGKGGEYSRNEPKLTGLPDPSELPVTGVIIDTGMPPTDVVDSAGLAGATGQVGVATNDVEPATQDIAFTGFVDQTKRIEALLSALGLTDVIRVSQEKDTKLFDLSVLMPDTISYITPDLTPTGTGTPFETVIETPWVTQSTEAAGGLKPWVIGVATGAGLLVLIAIIVMVVCLSCMKKGGSDRGREAGETHAIGMEFVEALPRGKSDAGSFDSNATIENPLFQNASSAPASAVYQDEDEPFAGDDDLMDDGAMVV